MNMNTMERLTLLSILPAEGTFATLKIVRVLREDLSLSDEEHTILETKQEDGVIRWNPEKDFEKTVEIGRKAEELIKECLEKLNSGKKLTEQHFSLYEKFMGE